MHMSMRYMIQTKHLLVVHKLTHTDVSEICDTDIKTKHLLDVHKLPHSHVSEICDTDIKAKHLLEVHKLPHMHATDATTKEKLPVQKIIWN